jgi:3-hydroxyacyl-CoA dehydrogenase
MAQPLQIKTVAIVGAGLIGKGWAIVFAMAGLNARVFDSSEHILGNAADDIANMLADMQRHGLAEDVQGCLSRVMVCSSLAEALNGADYIQESVLETVPVKQAVSRDIDALMGEGAVVGSSSSGIPASDFTSDLKNRERFYVVHPVNPPHLIPLVEIVPAPWSNRDLLAPLRSFLEAVGKKPIVVEKEIEGFILNRLQGVLLNEAWALFEDGYASLEDIDRTVSEGLGLRWSFMGPFETIDLNAPGGIDDYAQRLAPLYHRIGRSRDGQAPWSAEAIEDAKTARRRVLALDKLPDQCRVRDEKLMALLRHKKPD